MTPREGAQLQAIKEARTALGGTPPLNIVDAATRWQKACDILDKAVDDDERWERQA